MAADVALRLDPAIAGHTAGTYRLVDDLVNLHGVRQVGAAEATIFYCARILEVLASSAIQAMGLPPSASPFSNIETLAQFNLMPTTTLYWANALRRLGNDVRHVLRRTEARDADLAALFTERWIDWYFCKFRLGPNLAQVTMDGSVLLPAGDPSLPPLLREIDSEDFDPAAWLPRAGSNADPPYMYASTIAAVVANILLDRGEIDAAFSILDPARQRFPDDLRLAQLTVFGYKRRGELEKAAQSIGPLLARSKDDDETAGIVAGIYKQLYFDRGRDLENLTKSFRAYFSGWEGSKSSNAYLGVNAAALALWLDRPADSRRLAGEVRQLLTRRLDAMKLHQRQTQLQISYWDEVTLAEAELLQGDLAAARRRYNQAFARSAKSKGNIKVATDQAQRHLPLLGLTITAAEFLGLDVAPTQIRNPQSCSHSPSIEGEGRGEGSSHLPAPLSDAPPLAAQPPPAAIHNLTIGVSGHRVLSDESSLRGRLNDAIAMITRAVQRGGATPRLTILSPLAAGADCLVAEAVLEQRGAQLDVALPLELADYKNDFIETELIRFQALLNRAQSIVFPPPAPKPQRGKGAPSSPPAAESPSETRNAAYERVGQYVVDHCDVLIALWDGRGSRGRGGTAEIVEYARQKNRRVVWINANPPYEITEMG